MIKDHFTTQDVVEFMENQVLPKGVSLNEHDISSVISELEDKAFIELEESYLLDRDLGIVVIQALHKHNISLPHDHTSSILSEIFEDMTIKEVRRFKDQIASVGLMEGEKEAQRIKKSPVRGEVMK